MIFVGRTPKSFSDSQYAYQVLAREFSKRTHGQPLPHIQRGAQGKPYFQKPPGSLGEFNVSHSKGYVAVALGDCPVGVDLQVHKLPSPSLVKRVCSVAEQQWLQGQEEGFSLLWALKESYVKCRGEGIGTGRGLAQLPLPLPEKGQASQTLACPPYWFYLCYEREYSLAVTTEGEEPTTIYDLDNTSLTTQRQSPP